MKLPIEMFVKIQAVLTPELVNKEFRNHPYSRMAGHCYTASEALYHLWAKKAGYQPYRTVVLDPILGGVAHWYLRKGDEVLDLTSAQFFCEIPYYDGERSAFLTKQPSRRAKEIIKRVKALGSKT